MKNVFISFDMDDTRMIDLLRMQAKNNRFLFEFRDYSVKELLKYRWKKRVITLIRLSGIVIVAIGRNTHRSKAVNWEIYQARRQHKRIIGIRLHRYKRCKTPHAMKIYDKVINWNARHIAYVLEYG